MGRHGNDHCCDGATWIDEPDGFRTIEITHENHPITSDEQHLDVPPLHLRNHQRPIAYRHPEVRLTRGGNGCPSSVTSTMCIDSSTWDMTRFMWASYAYIQSDSASPTSERMTD
jgi:hypothetical protein